MRLVSIMINMRFSKGESVKVKPYTGFAENDLGVATSSYGEVFDIHNVAVAPGWVANYTNGFDLSDRKVSDVVIYTGSQLGDHDMVCVRDVWYEVNGPSGVMWTNPYTGINMGYEVHLRRVAG